MKYSNIPAAQTIVQLCKQKNIQHIIISPGSRNAPLTIGFSEDTFFKTYSIVDERCAAFFAMGIAQQLRMPTAVVCTSGSALLNYYPAISEAFYSDIPLLVISADRPDHAIDIGDGQTIRQKNVFENHILYSANLKLDIRKEFVKITEDGKNTPSILKELSVDNLQKGVQHFNEFEINKAIDLASQKKGPVHINVPFEEPLYQMVDKPLVEIGVRSGKAVSPELNSEDLRPYLDIWNSSKRKMILVGVNFPEQIDQEVLDILAEDESVVVFTETTSNLYHEKFFPGIDKIIAPIEKTSGSDELFSKLQPDVLITFGGLIVSKKIKAFLRKYQPKHHWHIDQKKAYDTFFCLNKHFQVSPNDLLKLFLPQAIQVTGDYQKYWLDIQNKRREKHRAYLNQIPFTDFKVFDHIFNSVPDNYQLQLSNSSTIRYAQLYELNPTLKVFCNRGTSGIDGSTSTAIGAALPEAKSTLLITGDLSFFYDSNALWNNYIKSSFRIIVINNSGGGIFRILPGHKNTDNFDTYFETKHTLTADHLCNMFGFEYLKAEDEDEAKKGLKRFFEESKKPKLLEIFTPRQLNDEVLLGYFEFLK
ncbi:2-succinyl-5-enolpyruvyl-6-hydroxy-3-cyclohexene-1-carboxylic-acid synthase [Zhouia spongiae]|uniref:2-succinyl-5-enolpyruvyl-6-hydroxy-3-cyclohexene-1-carboxylate synthase n=1 Tax=Zhouia spongiae TaxID=2202721 RepID=A0ABY3YJB7_9FLAO|nr:2-succinyl-5-enolpyruvyl-6-hydroxy-3-cyclohexene-1-carboxylic-acid synthase [Zhouia spongiae]UNY97950.1 2-succinyl-5-enolpyruvyl-6-hydroxy-3-cyclohexene-1-carboxylic-acid synthase [Zhouia spongiae]